MAWSPTRVAASGNQSLSNARTETSPAQLPDIRAGRGAEQGVSNGAHTRAGVVGNYGLTRGGELGWNPFVPTTPGPRTVLNGDLGELIPLMFGPARLRPGEVRYRKAAGCRSSHALRRGIRGPLNRPLEVLQAGRQAASVAWLRRSGSIAPGHHRLLRARREGQWGRESAVIRGAWRVPLA